MGGKRKEFVGYLNILTCPVDLIISGFGGTLGRGRGFRRAREEIWERVGEPKKKEEGGRREKKRIMMMLGPDTPKDPTPSICGQEDRNGRRKTHSQLLLSKVSDSWITFLFSS